MVTKIIYEVQEHEKKIIKYYDKIFKFNVGFKSKECQSTKMINLVWSSFGLRKPKFLVHLLNPFSLFQNEPISSSQREQQQIKTNNVTKSYNASSILILVRIHSHHNFLFFAVEDQWIHGAGAIYWYWLWFEEWDRKFEGSDMFEEWHRKFEV